MAKFLFMKSFKKSTITEKPPVPSRPESKVEIIIKENINKTKLQVDTEQENKNRTKTPFGFLQENLHRTATQIDISSENMKSNPVTTKKTFEENSNALNSLKNYFDEQNHHTEHTVSKHNKHRLLFPSTYLHGLSCLSHTSFTLVVPPIFLLLP